MANLGACVQEIAHRGLVLISAETCSLLREKVAARPFTPVTFKGIPDHVTVHEVTGLKQESGFWTFEGELSPGSVC